MNKIPIYLVLILLFSSCNCEDITIKWIDTTFTFAEYENVKTEAYVMPYFLITNKSNCKIQEKFEFSLYNDIKTLSNNIIKINLDPNSMQKISFPIGVPFYIHESLTDYNEKHNIKGKNQKSFFELQNMQYRINDSLLNICKMKVKYKNKELILKPCKKTWYI